MTEETKPEPSGRKRVLPIVILVMASFILGIGVAALIFPPRAKTNLTELVSVGLKVGQLAPDFTLNTLDDSQVALSDFAGQPVLINFWASWCVGCIEEMPALVRSYQDHKAEGFTIIGINLTYIDSPPDVRVFVDKFSISFPVLLDRDGQVAGRLYQVLGIPTSIFLKRDGTIARVQIGKMTGEQIDQYVLEILK